ncbi:WecB/TagA/CpsF family glycosyltransferase [Hyphomonas sp.]|uniref:WecB/TagA/CpsF family glycosyltransferase n=1 Tax=Hyphomonas sp. TaxID=87 RepID=UPI00391982C8
MDKVNAPAGQVSFLGFDFEPMETGAAVARLAAEASAAAPFAYVVTPNADHRVRLEREPELWPLYRSAGLVLNDSRILARLAKFDGLDLPASPGADVVTGLFDTVIRADEPVVIIGGVDGDIAALRMRYGLTDIRWHQPPNPLRTNPQAIAAAAAFIAANPARFHFLCVGSPQQEMVASAALGQDGAAGIGLCCGASLEFLSGRVARAPEWMRAAGLEWLFRLGSQPRRLAKRYLIEGPAIFRIWQAARRTKA